MAARGCGFGSTGMADMVEAAASLGEQITKVANKATRHSSCTVE